MHVTVACLGDGQILADLISFYFLFPFETVSHCVALVLNSLHRPQTQRYQSQSYQTSDSNFGGIKLRDSAKIKGMCYIKLVVCYICAIYNVLYKTI